MTNRLKFRTYCKLDNTIRACNTEEDFKLLYDILYNDNEDYIILQSTGLLDKNRKEIFEGDLIKGEYEGEQLIFEVIHKKVSFVLKRGIMTMSFTNVNNIEIIGNTYKNPELLEK